MPRRRKDSSAALVVGLSVGGGVLLLAVVVAVVLAAGGRRGEPVNPGPAVGEVVPGRPAKPEGKKTVGTFQEADDPTVVDRVWPKLLGTWKLVVEDGTQWTYVFFPDYRYRSTTDLDGKHQEFNNPVEMIRDDAGTTNAKTRECYSVFYREGSRENGRFGNEILNFYPDGTLDINGHRFRRVK